jgi:hypothetical protein
MQVKGEELWFIGIVAGEFLAYKSFMGCEMRERN